MKPSVENILPSRKSSINMAFKTHFKSTVISGHLFLFSDHLLVNSGKKETTLGHLGRRSPDASQGCRL